MEQEISIVYQAVLDGDMANIQKQVQEALAAGIASERILKSGLIPAMSEIGRLFETGECYVPEMLVSAKTMQSGMEVLKPYLVDDEVKPVGTAVIGTVKGDLHDIGKNLVAMMLEGSGFAVHDLGVDVPPEKFVAAAMDYETDILALSALLTTTMVNMKSCIDSLTTAGIRDQVKVLVGGAPVSEAFALEIGADGLAADAGQAATLAKKLLSNEISHD